MLCVKCKTAVDANGGNCAYCGAKINKNKLRYMTAALFALCLGLVFGVSYFTGLGLKLTESAENIPVTDMFETPQGGDYVFQPDLSVNTDAETAQGQENGETEKTAEEIYKVLTDAAAASQEFFDKFSSYAVYVTNRGHLYEYLSGTYIKPRDFGAAGTDGETVRDGVLLLYLKTNDLTGYSGLDITESESLVIFAAYETKEGFMLQSYSNGGGILPREDLRKVLAGYSNVHGAIKKIPEGSDDYYQISALIGNMYGGASSFDYRYLYRDNKYCAAVTSPTGDSIDISEHILFNENGTWYLGMPNYDKSEKYRAVVNTNFVDINLELIPGYGAAAFSGSLRSGYPEVVRAMRLNGMIAEYDEPITFESGTDDFCYIESVSGRKFVGNLNKDGMWETREISSYEQGAEHITSLTNKPPLFILKQF